MPSPRTLALSASGALLAVLIAPAPAMAQGQPAGGAAIDQVVIATVGALLVTAVLLVLGEGHRSGRLSLLGRAAAFAERRTGIPGWASLPAALSTISLLIALFGMYWDISLHIDQGRDEGPLANAAHFFILGGLFGIFSAGFIGMVLPGGRPSRSAIRIAGDWHAPLGAVLVCACGAFSLIGFPLDDIWHRLFGQDVTLWGPTHLMLIGGAAMTLVGMAVLLVEGVRAANGAAAEGNGTGEMSWAFQARRVALVGGFLIGLSTFQAEFDFGVPQFRLVFQPLLIMLAAAVALVAARLWLGRGAALGAALFFVAVRGGLALLVGPALGESTPHLPLYLVEAGVVELAALGVRPRERPVAFGALAGALIGTVGLAAEWGWSHVWMPIPWPASLLPEGAVLGFAGALAGGLLGAWIGARLNGDVIRPDVAQRAAALAGAAVIALSVGYALYKPPQEGVTARVALEEAQGGPARTVNATVRIEPAAAARDAEWLTATAWQGGGLIVNPLEEVGPGRFRTTEPIPVHGNWKALIRLHRGDSLTVAPVYLPEDRAIPAPEVPARPTFERAFVADHEVLQREQKGGAPWLSAMAYGVVIGIALALLALLAWGLHRVSRAGDGPLPTREERRRAQAPAPPGGRAAPAAG